MKKTIKTKLIAVFIALFSLFFVAGCGKLNDTLDDVLEEYQVTSQITYYAGEEGYFGNDVSGNLIRTRTLYYKTAQKPLAIGLVDVGNAITLSSTEYEIIGWEIVKTDAEGNPLFEDDAKIIPQSTGEAFDFSKTLEDGKTYHLVAVWQMVEKLDVKLLDSGFNFVVGGKTYSAGDILNSFSYSKSGTVSRPKTPLDTGNAYTFLEYYTDAAGTTVATWPIARNNNGENKVVYARFLEGKWSLLKTAMDVSNMFTAGTANYYLCNDIDCTGMEFGVLSQFSGKLQGNNFKISNLNFAATKINADTSILGVITQTAQIKDVTFENVTLTLRTMSSGIARLYFVFTKLATGAMVENVAINGGAFYIDSGDNFVIENTADNWLFGGYATDADYTGITVTNVAAPSTPQNN